MTRAGNHCGYSSTCMRTRCLCHFVHQPGPEPASRHTWLQAAKLGFDGNTLTCDRDADFDFILTPPAPGFTPEQIPIIPER